MSNALPHRRRFLALGLVQGARVACAGGLGLAATGCTPPRHRERDPARLRLIGQARLPYRMEHQGTVVGGLSAIDFDAASERWYVLSDDRSDLGPARAYRLRMNVAADRLDSPQVESVIPLLQADGTPYPNRRRGGDVPDPEALRLRPDTRTLLWTSEGDRKLKLAPFLREVRLDGSHVRHLQLPPAWQQVDHSVRGPRDNLGPEGLALTPEGRHAWVAMESALLQDGPMPSVDAPGGPCRLAQIDLATGQPVREVAYVPDPIPRASIPPGSFADNGVSEILMIDAHRMLVLERAFMMGVGMSLRLYEIDTRQGSDTLATDRLRVGPGGNTRVCPKTLVADFAQLGIDRLDNTEGLCWGPRLGNGNRTLVAVSDDNFNALQITQFLAFEYLETVR